MSDYLNSFRLRNQEKLDTNQMDPRHLELSSLFEFSQTLNSSLELKSILDSLLYVPMGRMMIGKGMVLLAESENTCKIATVKGLSPELINKTFCFENKPTESLEIKSNEDYQNLPAIFAEHKLKLIIPIKSMNQVTGLMILGSKLLAPGYSQDELHFLSSIGNIAAPAIENAKVFEKLNSVNRQLDHKIQELNTLFEIGNELNRQFDQNDILKRLSYSLMGQMLINQFFVAVKINSKLEVVYRKGSIFSEDHINKCLKSGIGKKDITTPIRIEEADDIMHKKFCDFGIKIVVPMLIQEQVRGYIFLGPKLNKSEFSESDVEFLSTLANIAIISIENARLFQETLEKKRMEEELNLAKNIQSKLLPDSMPEINRYDVHGYNIPSKSVGGDYYDILKLNDNEFIFTIADVSGKGMPASLLMSNLQAGLHTLHKEKYSLAEITFRLNNLIHRNTSIEKYITFFIAKLDTIENKIYYVNAGHNPPYMFYQDGSYDELTTGGIILGMMANMPYEIGSLEMKPGSYLTMFTDGVTEAMSPEDEPFDEHRVIDFFKSELANPGSCEKINMKLIDVLYHFAGDPTKDDDITVLTISRQE